MVAEYPIYQVDAFAESPFSGNPAAVVPLREWLPDPVMQAIAAENNLAETAFFIPRGGDYALRWFTPAIEVELCGHATLATAWVIFELLQPGRRQVSFETLRAGVLTVSQNADMVTLDFPTARPEPITPPAGLSEALGAAPQQVLASGRLMLTVFAAESDVAALQPDFRAVAKFPYTGIIATAPGDDDVDFVSRFFAPAAGIDEDPVTGSAHCLLIPYWSERLRKKTLEARQISPRGGRLVCTDRGTRVDIAGRARLYLEGRIYLP